MPTAKNNYQTQSEIAVSFEEMEGLTAGDDVVEAVIEAEKLKALLRYWHAIRGDLTIPAREAFDPVDIPDLLPHVVFAEVRRPGPRFFVRVHGTALVQNMKRSMTGKYIDEVDFGDAKASTLRVFRYIHDNAVPTYRTIQYHTKDREYRFERLGVPFGADGSVSHIMIGAIRTSLA